MALGCLGGTGLVGRPSSAAGPHDRAGSSGTSLAEMALVLAIISCVLGVGLPVLANGADSKRTRDAASFLAGQFRLARQRAVLTGHHVGIAFDDVAGEVGWRMCEDGDRDGLSRDDIGAGVDRCAELAQPLSYRFPQVKVEYAPGVPSPDGESGAAPLRFGLTRLAVFTPIGTASSGTIALLGGGGSQFAVRVSGVTGRTRVLRFDAGSRLWIE